LIRASNDVILAPWIVSRNPSWHGLPGGRRIDRDAWLAMCTIGSSDRRMGAWLSRRYSAFAQA
jgi:hypothetical protein